MREMGDGGDCEEQREESCSQDLLYEKRINKQKLVDR